MEDIPEKCTVKTLEEGERGWNGAAGSWTIHAARYYSGSSVDSILQTLANGQIPTLTALTALLFYCLSDQ